MRAEDWDRRYATADLIWTAEPNRFVVEQVSPLAPGTAIDLACGEGRNAVWLADHGWTVTGVDFSAVALEKAARLAAHRGVDIELVRADLSGWDAPSAADLVLIAYLQVPAQIRAPILAAASRAVAPGGVLLVVGHDVDNLARGVGGPRDPEVLMTPEAIADDLVGLEIEHAVRVSRPTPEGAAIDTLVRARRPATAAGQAS